MLTRKISYAQNNEDILLFRCFSNKDSGFYIDVGAADPQKNSVTKLFYDRGWNGINIEPIPFLFSRIVRERPRDINLNLAVSDSRQSLKFYNIENGSLSTASEVLADNVLRDLPSVEIVETTVEATTLADVCAIYATAKIDFLKIDVEGWELQVIHGGDWQLFRPSVLVVEATRPNTGELSVEWEPVLLENDYICAYFDGINRFYVAREARHLMRHFAVPVNWFDGFLRWKEVEANLERVTLGESLSKLLKKTRAHRSTFAKSVERANIERRRIASFEKNQENLNLLIQKLKAQVRRYRQANKRLSSLNRPGHLERDPVSTLIRRKSHAIISRFHPLGQLAFPRSSASKQETPDLGLDEYVAEAGVHQRLTRALVCARVGDSICDPGRARSIWAVNTASALAAIGYDALLAGGTGNLPLGTDRRSDRDPRLDELRRIYGVQGDFQLFDVGRNEKAMGHAEWLALIAEKLLLNVDFAHIRDPDLAVECDQRGVPFVYEDHNEDYHLSASPRTIRALNGNQCRLVVAITDSVGDRLMNSGAQREKIVVADSGVSSICFNRQDLRAHQWRRFFLEGHFNALAFYGGGLQSERGIEDIIDAALRLPRHLFVLAGGTPGAVETRRREIAFTGAENIRVIGYQPLPSVIEIQQSADVLLLTRDSSDRQLISSPLKLFEYLASGTPIVSYDLQTSISFQSENALTLYRAGDSLSLAHSILDSVSRFPFSGTGYPHNIGIAANFTWTARERRLLERSGLLGAAQRTVGP